MFLGMNVYAEKNECIPKEVIKISSLIPGMKSDVVNVETATSNRVSLAEDDGGEVKVYEYDFNGYSINLVREHIDSIKITKPDIVWYKTIHVGMARETAENIIKIKPVYRSNNVTSYVVCSEGDELYAELGFINNMLTEISVMVDRS